MTAEEFRDLLLAQVDLGESQGVDSLVLFGGMAMAFGDALSRYLDPETALAFMRRETDRIALQSALPARRLQ